MAVRIAAGILLLIGLVCVVGWWLVIRPQQRLREILTLQVASPAETREAAHAALRFPGPDPHDAFVVLAEHGDASSVRVLIRALYWQPRSDAPNRSTVCTKSHCLEALRKLTGSNPGDDYEDWSPLLDSAPNSGPRG